MGEVVLIRHAEVEPKWKGICYGSMDVSLSKAGIDASHLLVASWSVRPRFIVHSGLKRTKMLAEMFMDRFPSLSLFEDQRLRERNFGQWEGRSWDAIFETNPDFHDLVHQPDTYRPPDGETTTEVQERAVEAFESLGFLDDGQVESCLGPILAISHSGPIAGLAGHFLELPPSEWTPWMVGYLGSLTLHRDRPNSKIQVSRRT
jgi:broad specificity phosphatase PhoE